jgi:hypothetical protein
MEPYPVPALFLAYALKYLTTPLLLVVKLAEKTVVIGVTLPLDGEVKLALEDHSNPISVIVPPPSLEMDPFNLADPMTRLVAGFVTTVGITTGVVVVKLHTGPYPVPPGPVI